MIVQYGVEMRAVVRVVLARRRRARVATNEPEDGQPVFAGVANPDRLPIEPGLPSAQGRCVAGSRPGINLRPKAARQAIMGSLAFSSRRVAQLVRALP